MWAARGVNTISRLPLAQITTSCPNQQSLAADCSFCSPSSLTPGRPFASNALLAASRRHQMCRPRRTARCAPGLHREPFFCTTHLAGAHTSAGLNTVCTSCLAPQPPTLPPEILPYHWLALRPRAGSEPFGPPGPGYHQTPLLTRLSPSPRPHGPRLATLPPQQTSGQGPRPRPHGPGSRAPLTATGPGPAPHDGPSAGSRFTLSPRHRLRPAQAGSRTGERLGYAQSETRDPFRP